jgi:uncharacterized protein YndB with AHSA1/START domain
MKNVPLTALMITMLIATGCSRERRSAEIEESVWLNAKPEEVWPYLVQPEKLTQWLTEMHEVAWLDEGPIRVGNRYVVEKEVRGEVHRYESEVTKLEENRLYGFTSEATGFSRVEGVWELAPEHGGCRFTMRERIDTQANWLIERLFVQPGAARAVRRFQAQLKQLIENRDT